MPTLPELKKRRDNLRKREDRVERLTRGAIADLRQFRDVLEEEREERDQFEARRKDLREELEEEIRRDKRGEGLHPEAWEQWAENRRDELADLIDASESRVKRVLRKAAQEKSLIADLRKRDNRLERKIDIVVKEIAEAKKNKKGQLTKDFHVEEFNCNDGTRIVTFCPYIIPHLKQMCVRHLQPLRNSGGSVNSTSALRHRAYNASIGGADNSYHCYEIRRKGPAVDHVQSGRSAGSVQQWHESHNPFDGMGFYSGFTHGDDRGYRSRWYGAG